MTLIQISDLPMLQGSRGLDFEHVVVLTPVVVVTIKACNGINLGIGPCADCRRDCSGTSIQSPVFSRG